MENDNRVILGYSPVKDEDNNERYVLNEICFSDKNHLMRFGEFLTIMRGYNSFDLYNGLDGVVERIELIPYAEDNSEDINKSEVDTIED